MVRYLAFISLFIYLQSMAREEELQNEIENYKAQLKDFHLQATSAQQGFSYSVIRLC